MDYEQLKLDIDQIVTISNTVPEPFREKCFELLLTHLLRQKIGSGTTGLTAEQSGTNYTYSETANQLPLNAQLRAFMRRTDITQQDLESLVIYDPAENKCHFIRKPRTNSNVEGQIDWALLLALETAIYGRGFVIDPEELRQVCQEEGFYDPANFAANLRRYGSYFKNALESKGPPQSLSDDGEAELAIRIRKLIQVT